MFGLHGLGGLFQPQQCCDSMICCSLGWSGVKHLQWGPGGRVGIGSLQKQEFA